MKLITYSYQYTHGVPGNGYTVSDNVIIDFCFDDACYNHAFNDPDCPKNTPVAAELKEWAKLCRADNLYVYEYAYNCGDKYLADPSLLVMWDNFRFYTECGVEDIAEGLDCRATTTGEQVVISDYCIRREIGECLLERPRLRGDLYIVRGTKKYRLCFDCKACQMKIIDEK